MPTGKVSTARPILAAVAAFVHGLFHGSRFVPQAVDSVHGLFHAERCSRFVLYGEGGGWSAHPVPRSPQLPHIFYKIPTLAMPQTISLLLATIFYTYMANAH